LNASLQAQEEVKLYDEVTEDQYKSIVKGRLQKDDFVVDDGVGGYMDNGMDDWTGAEKDEDDSDEYETKKKGKFADTYTLNCPYSRYLVKKSKGGPSKPKAKPKAAPVTAKPTISMYRPAVSAEQEEDFMANLLGGLDTAPAPAPRRPKRRKPSPLSDFEDTKGDFSSSPALQRTRTPYIKRDASPDGTTDDAASNLPSSDFEDDLAAMMSPKKKLRVATGGITPAIERMGKLGVHSGSEGGFDSSMDFEDVDMDAFMDIDDEDLGLPAVKKQTLPGVETKPKVNGASASTKAEPLPAPTWLSVYDSLAVTSDETLGSGSSSSASKSSVDALEPDGTLRFFWLDYLEHNGKLFLTGKVKEKTSSSWVSACLAVEGLQRNLFMLPRPLRIEQEETEEGEYAMLETDVVPSKSDVYEDFERIRKKLGIKAWKGRWIRRNYAFDERDVPKEGEWMKVLYSFEGIPQVLNFRDAHYA
jgi:DNA polymerase alpha subunit A